MEKGQTKKRRRGERDGGRRTAKRLYLIFDDWPWGYTIRELDLSSPTVAAGAEPLRLPQPFIRLEAPRGYPLFFAAAGTRIISTHRRNPWDDDSVPDGFLPIVDVRSRGITFGPGRVLHNLPIYLPVASAGGSNGWLLFELDTITVRTLSLKPLWPPRLENPSSADVQWAWCELLDPPPFDRMGVTSYAVHPDGRTVLFSTEGEGTFAFDAAAASAAGEELAAAAAAGAWEEEQKEIDVAWTWLGEWALPFAGRAHFVHGLNAFVGLSKDPATVGHLCSCEAAAMVGGKGGGGAPPAWKVGKENLFGEDDPGERHVGATLLYMGGSEFCLVQSVSVDDEHAGDDAAAGQEEMEIDDEEEEDQVLRCSNSHLYRVITFSVSYDGSNGDLTIGETCRVRCYKVPEATTASFLSVDPVAFWL
ncbi:unnamed protein product [Urochloa humidicola]